MIYSKEFFEQMMEKNGGNLDISDTVITKLPDKLTVRGDLILNRLIKQLPDELTIEGNLDMRNTNVDLAETKFLTVNGNLFTGPKTEIIGDVFVAGGVWISEQAQI